MSTFNKDNIDTRYRRMMILWIAQVMSVVMFFAITQHIEVLNDRPENNILSFVFAAVGTFCAIFLFVVRAKLLRTSVEKQDLKLVQTANAVGRALCDVPAILGVIEKFLLPGREHIAASNKCARNLASLSAKVRSAGRVLQRP